MGLLFCCPSCGADLRVNPVSATLVSCPGCGEPIRVPRRPHPREAATDTPGLPADSRRQATRGLHLLSVSVWVFVSAGAGVAGSLLLRVLLGPFTDDYPTWLPPVQLTLAGWWLTLAAMGCGCRVRGYLLCRRAADQYALAPWATAAAVGAGLAAVGVLAVVPAVIGRPSLHLPPLGLGLVLIGLTTGFIGLLAEFAFLTILHRLLWETAGWEAAGQPGRYAVAFVFGLVAAVGSVCVGAMATAFTPNGAGESARLIGVVVVAAVCGCSVYLVWRFARLLRLTCTALSQPEPSQDPPVPSSG